MPNAWAGVLPGRCEGSIPKAGEIDRTGTRVVLRDGRSVCDRMRFALALVLIVVLGAVSPCDGDRADRLAGTAALC